MLFGVMFSTSFFQSEYLSVINYLSSIVKWGNQDNFKHFFFFFWRKDFARTKTCHTLELYARVKIVVFVVSCYLIFVLLADFRL